MTKIKVEGVGQFSGEYDFDIGTFNGRELHEIKVISGVRAGELREALMAGDYDLVVAFTVIVLRRAGHTVNPDQIFEAEIGAITIDLGASGDDSLPPVPAPPGHSGAQNDDSGSSGRSSKIDGDNRANGLSPIGAHGSEITADFALETSAT